MSISAVHRSLHSEHLDGSPVASICVDDPGLRSLDVLNLDCPAAAGVDASTQQFVLDQNAISGCMLWFESVRPDTPMPSRGLHH